MSDVALLIDAYLDDELTPEQAQYLCAWIKASPEHALRFTRRALIHGLARQHMAAQDVSPFAMGVAVEVDDNLTEGKATVPPPIDIDLILEQVRKQKTEPRRRAAPSHARHNVAVRSYPERSKARTATVRHIVIPRLVAYGVPTVVAAALVLMFWMLGPSHPKSSIGESATPDGRHGAMVAATVDATWDAQWDQATPLEVGTQLFPGTRFTLDQGIVELTMRHGATVILEGPCVVEVRDGNAMQLDHGKLIAHVPPRASQFAVHTPVTRIVDIGTEFGVVSDEHGQVEVHVFTGEVVLHAVDATREGTRLFTGQAARIDAQSHAMRTFEADAGTFARGMAYQQRNRMTPHIERIRSAGPVAYWRFGDMGHGFVPGAIDDRYRAVAFGQLRVADASGRRSLVFGEGADGYVMIESIAELRDADHYTIECWFNPREVHRAVLLRLVDSIRIELTGEQADDDLPARSIRFLPHASSDPHRSAMVSPLPYQVDQWQHLVVTKAGPELRLYLNGRLVQTATDDRRLPSTIHAMHLGVDRAARGDSRPFRGQIDELAVYRHALSADQVAEHYQSWMNEQLQTRP